MPGDSPAQVRRQSLRYLVVDDQALLYANQTIAAWQQKYDAELVKAVAFMVPWAKPEKPLTYLYLVRLR